MPRSRRYRSKSRGRRRKLRMETFGYAEDGEDGDDDGDTYDYDFRMPYKEHVLTTRRKNRFKASAPKARRARRDLRALKSADIEGHNFMEKGGIQNFSYAQRRRRRLRSRRSRQSRRRTRRITRRR